MSSATTPHQVRIRRAVPADATAVADIHIAARAAAPMPDGIHTAEAVHAWLARRLAADEVWVAVDAADAVVGYVRLTDAWLEDLFVAPAHARRGIGSTMLDLVKARRPAGFSLMVFETNAPARAFYARHGLVEREHGCDNEEREPDLRMSWDVPAVSPPDGPAEVGAAPGTVPENAS